ncbi:ATP-binding protein [Streptomyces sp. NPDC057621]|uniref:ATP-binding protein n=1 Tax=Streptomyces liliiviolaceus TaxID=2823109 RepID=A0A941BA96_9ACTN|nr:ATP-binding protein [Streptomyces liliiviolaceus]MBQ0853601.1 ATP-binding protein [Streptomyces liliiviolaceus]
MISQPSKHCTVELNALPSRIGQVRRIVSAQLRYWRLDPLIDRAALGVTELLTNVHLHARPDKLCTVEIELLLDRLTVSVHDRDPRLPEVRDATSLATCGRGLSMVAAVSESWGVRPDGESGKVVWFTLTAPAPAPALPMRPPYAAVAGAGGVGFVEVEHAGDGLAPASGGGHAPARSAVAG